MEVNTANFCSTRISKFKHSNAPSLSINVGRSDEEVAQSPGAKLWHSALLKARTREAKLDPWNDFDLSIPTIAAVRHRYSALKKKWIKDDILIKMEKKSFGRGAMRECFRLKKASDNGDWTAASNYVAKRYLSPVSSTVYLDDVRLQMEAKLWANAFNKRNPPKKVDVFQMSVIEVLDCLDSPPLVCDSKRRGSITLINAPPIQQKAKSTQFYHIERFMDGEYRKYNSNSGFVDDQPRNTPQAFSHFTFEHSGHRLLVVDIQGVGDLYTDPQIHTVDGLGYNDGNLGLRGMALFFHSHRCNPLCNYLGLVPFNLSENEVKDLYAIYTGLDMIVDDDTSQYAMDAGGSEVYKALEYPSPSVNNLSPQPNDYSLASSLTDSDASLPSQVRKKSLSYGMIPLCFSLSPSHSACYRSNAKQFYGPTVIREDKFRVSRRFRTFSASTATEMAHCVPPVKARAPSHHFSSSTECVDTDSLLLPDSAFDIDSGFSWEDEASVVPIRLRGRRTRTISESSDVDNDLAAATAGSLFHQSIHETHKPSSATHPSNLDQEIGHSILGQIHHELACLHEAGRFVKRHCGGWSHCGLGGLSVEDETKPHDADLVNSVDWESVLFHERLAAQLGCLEALITMSHYYLGLPLQLLSDCPIKPREEDLSLGVDYLWRSSMGGDRRCMILFARYMDASVVFGGTSSEVPPLIDRVVIRKSLNLRTTLVDDFLVLLSSHRGFPLPAGSTGRAWAEAVVWYRKAIKYAGIAVPGGNSSSGVCETDEGCESEGRYDSAEDLSPIYCLLARLAEIYEVGGHGVQADLNMAGELYTEAAESATQQTNGRLAVKYFELAEEAYAKAGEGG